MSTATSGTFAPSALPPPGRCGGLQCHRTDRTTTAIPDALRHGRRGTACRQFRGTRRWRKGLCSRCSTEHRGLRKKDYKHFNIKTVVGPDDYASMKEVVHRRYTRLLDEEQPLPDLIIADGGKGQMEVIREVIQDELNLDIPIAGLAKDDRHRTNELLYGFPPLKVALKVESELFHVLTHIQDEVHRFAIEFHRNKRSKRALHSELDDIKGIGPKTRDELLKALKSVKRIREADLETLTNAIGASKAKIIYEHFHPGE